MDVELQIIKHLKRDAQPTIAVIDKYCSSYKDLFPEVRSYECFKYLHLGIISAYFSKLQILHTEEANLPQLVTDNDCQFLCSI
jgi:SRSO17 transposase